ncbi:hypothetical protein F5Y16DRAFT_393779 [Xylariaceae sp. FL0255]|nr:hypothetical protein F5Y16DRAFT_393779 [Xylariaceae sp. FL0255]
MERASICSSLRQRRHWAALAPVLLQSNDARGSGSAKWKECNLGSHDLAIPLQVSGNICTSFRAICMSPANVGSSESTRRIEHLYNLNGNQYVGIIFLLQSDETQQSPTAALMALQLILVGKWEMPIIPVESVTAMPEKLLILYRQLVSPTAYYRVTSPESSLLPFCTAKHQLTERTVNILSDTAAGFKDLLNQVSSSLAFEERITSLVGEEAYDLRNFWMDEYLVVD